MPDRSGRTRWMLAAGGAVAGVAAITATMATVGAARDVPVQTTVLAPAAAAAPAAPAPSASESSASESAGPVPSATTAPAARKPLGGVIDSGMKAKRGTWVFYAVPLPEVRLPGITFGIMAGRRLSDGTIAESVVINETQGSATSRGFHAVEGAMEVDGEPTPAFGYYAGPATKITATVEGRTVTARTRPYAWSPRRSVVVFWFDLKDVRVTATHSKADAGDTSGIPDDLRAYDRAGRRLPDGNATVAVG